MTRLSASELLRLPVRVGSVTLGYPTEVILDPAAGHIVGFEVVCRDGERRFLPLRAASVRGEDIAATSALTLLEPDHADFYRRRGRRLSALRGGRVVQGGRPVGILRDLIVAGSGAVEALLLDGGATVGEVPLDGHVLLDADGAARGA